MLPLVQVLSQSLCPTMATLNLGDTHLRLVALYVDGEGVLLSFLLGNDRVALITSLRSSLRFWVSEDFMYIDEEVFDVVSGDLRHTIGQFLVCDGDSKQWLLILGRFQVYGMSDSVMVASTKLATPHKSSTGTVQLTPVSR